MRTLVTIILTANITTNVLFIQPTDEVGINNKVGLNLYNSISSKQRKGNNKKN